MKVRIVKAFTDCWYKDQIGSIFNVREGLGLDDKRCYYFDTNHESNYIRFDDCEILPEENQPEPFDLERALKGEKVVTREGVVVDELYHFKTYHGVCPITVIMGGDKKTFRVDGKYNESGLDTKYDLFMASRESEYVTKWVNLYRAGCATWEDSEQEAIAYNAKTGYIGYIGTFPITFKRPS